MRRLARFIVKLAMIWAFASVVGRLVSRSYEGETGPDDDEFRVLAFMGGREVVSRAAALRKAAVVVTAGGVDLDLREATLAAGGAHLALRVTAGGIRVTVPPTWRVYVAEEAMMGGAVEVTTPAPDDLDEAAPMLTVAARAFGGGVLIESEE